VHHVIIQAHEGTQLRALLDYLRAFGVTRVTFPGREYRSERAGRNGGHFSEHERDTVRLSAWRWEQVRELIDGDGPIPSGLDPESIAAARRIARRLNSAA